MEVHMKPSLNWKMTLVLTLLLVLGTVGSLLSGTISGTVTNENNQPVANAYVQLMRLWPNAQNGEMLYRTTQTNPSGFYTFNDLPVDDYHVSAMAPEYVRSYYVSPDGQILVVEVDADDQEVVGIDIQLIPQNDPPPHEFGSVSGRVFNQDNLPVPNATVGIVSISDLTSPLPNLITHTSMNGFYMLHGIPAGTYKTCLLDPMNAPLAYSAEFIMTANASLDSIDIHATNLPPLPQFGSISGNVIGYQPTTNMMANVGLVIPDNPTAVLPNLIGHVSYSGYYTIRNIPVGTYMAALLGPNNTILAYSDTVQVIANQMIQNVDIILGTQVGFSLSGNVYTALNEPVTNGVVVLRSVPDSLQMNHMHTFRSTRLDSLGHYIFTNVPVGEYFVSVWTMHAPVVFYPSTFDISQAVPVSIVDQDVSGINITIPAPQTYTISGLVRDAATQAPLAGIKVRTDRMGFHHFPVHDSLFNNEFCAITDANGAYTLTLPAGRYTLAAVDTTHFYRIQFYDHAPIPFQATVILLDQNYTEVNFDLIPRLDSLHCSISGTITENGEPITYPVMVVAVSSDEDWEDSTISGNDGSYTINHIRPGSYYVIAYSLYNAPLYYDNVLTFDEADLVVVNGPISGINFNFTSTDADGPSNLAGVVTDGNGLTVSNAMVMLTDSENQVLGFARTNESGAYVISNVPSQIYTVVTTKIGYTSTTQEINLTGSQNLNLIINAPTANEDMVAPVIVSRISNYPNPFNPNTRITFATSKDAELNVKIYNIKGQSIKNLVNGNVKAGSHTLEWNGTDDNGKPVTSGIYLVKVQGNGYLQSHKMTLMK